MPNLSAQEITDMTWIAEDTFNDLCTIHQSTGSSQNSFGDVSHTYTDLEDVPCGLSFPGDKVFKAEVGQAVVLQADALLRISLTQALSVVDQVTARGKRFTVDGVHDGPTVRIAWLKSLETSE